MDMMRISCLIPSSLLNSIMHSMCILEVNQITRTDPILSVSLSLCVSHTHRQIHRLSVTLSVTVQQSIHSPLYQQRASVT